MTRLKPGPKPSGNAKVHITARISRWIADRISQTCRDTGKPKNQVIDETLARGLQETPCEPPKC